MLCPIGIPPASGRGVRFLGADQNLSAFCQAEAFYRSMNSSPDQSDLFPGFVPAPQMVFVNDRVSFQTEAKQRVILVHGVAYSHYSLEDRIAEAYALVKLYESGYADQNDLARAFGYSTRTLRRFQQRLHRGGLNALIRPQGRPAEDSISHIAPRDRIILRLKAQGLSNRGIAGRIGLDEKMIRKTLRRLGWRPAPEATLPLLPRADPPAPSAAVSESPAEPIPPPETPQAVLQEPPEAKPATPSFDPNPLDRSLDRLLAALGRLDDAQPLFAPAQNLPRAGVLLAIPALVASGLLPAAEKIYESLRPSFYGLRTTLVAYVLLALLRIRRPEALKEYSPGELGRIVGLDRMPEVKTLRRKLSQLAKRKGSYKLGQEIARRRIRERGRVVGFLYVDGHVRAYHGKHTIPKGFGEMLALGFDLLTYRKGRTRQIAEERFTKHQARLDGRKVEYLLHDQAVRFLKRKLRLRQITRLSPNGHQTPALTSRWDLPAVHVAYRMFERWRQENFFKYARQEYAIDVLVDYKVEPDDPHRSVPNPARKAVQKELRRTRAHLAKLREEYATVPRDLSRLARKRAKKELRAEIQQTTDTIKKLRARHHSLPRRVPVAQTQKEEVVKLSTERKHLTDVLKMVAYHLESDLVELIRPHYQRVEAEGRTLIQAALQDAADLEPTKQQLRITLAPLSSPHRSRVLETLCADLNETHTKFPGTELEMH